VLEADKERRACAWESSSWYRVYRQYITEHKVGDSVSGRIVDVSATRVKVELGEGVMAQCRCRAKVRRGSRRYSGRYFFALGDARPEWEIRTRPDSNATGLRAGEIRSSGYQLGPHPEAD